MFFFPVIMSVIDERGFICPRFQLCYLYDIVIEAFPSKRYSPFKQGVPTPTRLRKSNKSSKYVLDCKELSFLGTVMNRKGNKDLTERSEKFLKSEWPKTDTTISTKLELLNYYSRNILYVDQIQSVL